MDKEDYAYSEWSWMSTKSIEEIVKERSAQEKLDKEERQELQEAKWVLKYRSSLAKKQEKWKKKYEEEWKRLCEEVHEKMERLQEIQPPYISEGELSPWYYNQGLDNLCNYDDESTWNSSSLC